MGGGLIAHGIAALRPERCTSKSQPSLSPRFKTSENGPTVQRAARGSARRIHRWTVERARRAVPRGGRRARRAAVPQGVAERRPGNRRGFDRAARGRRRGSVGHLPQPARIRRFRGSRRDSNGVARARTNAATARLWERERLRCLQRLGKWQEVLDDCHHVCPSARVGRANAEARRRPGPRTSRRGLRGGRRRAQRGGARDAPSGRGRAATTTPRASRIPGSSPTFAGGAPRRRLRAGGFRRSSASNSPRRS